VLDDVLQVRWPNVPIVFCVTKGFDRGTYVNFWDHVERWRERGKAVVVVTHLLAQLDRVDRVVELAPHPRRSGDAGPEVSP
jgi:ABC-2 type transport system ATP-binding protein